MATRYMHMHKAFTLAVLAGFLLHPWGASAQIPEESTFDCGTISLSPSGESLTYYDLGRGFRFEFPADWVGRKVSLSNPSDNPCTALFRCSSQIIIHPLLAASDPRFYVSQGARVTGTETINGREWTALAWPDGRRGYYAYREGVAIEFVVFAYGKSRVPSASTLAGLTQILSSFSLLDGAYRADRQLAALKAGEKLGSLTIERIVPGTGGFYGTVGKVDFLGQVTLTGTVMFESTMGGGRSGYFMVSFDSRSVALIPHLKCPVDETPSPFAVRVSFRNQDFAEEQFGKHNWYEAKATVVVDNVIETFYSAGVRPSISARLIAVTEKKPIP